MANKPQIKRIFLNKEQRKCRFKKSLFNLPYLKSSASGLYSDWLLMKSYNVSLLRL